MMVTAKAGRRLMRVPGPGDLAASMRYFEQLDVDKARHIKSKEPLSGSQLDDVSACGGCEAQGVIATFITPSRWLANKS